MPHSYPYPRPSLTVDVALFTTGPDPRLLLIRRSGPPFAGMWALPGGFVDENEPLEQAARRELLEETGIEAGPLRQAGAYGNPGRDPRGWTVSVVFVGELAGEPPPPRGDDDAAEAGWHRLSELPGLAFDHARIVADAIRVVRPSAATA